MSWNYQTSLERVKNHLENMGEIHIEKLVRDADLDALLSETNCREIFGAHVYVNVTNFAVIASAVDGEDYRRVLQAIHLYQREVSRIVENAEIFDGVRIHFQGQRLHALFFRPIDSAEKLAAKALLFEAVLREFVATVFNPAFPKVADFQLSGGADLGSAIGTKNGTKGDRELLFLGAPANHAAKILGASGEMNIGRAVFEALPKSLRSRTTKIDEKKYRIDAISAATLQQLLSDAGIAWDPDASRERIEEDKDQFPLKNIEYSDAETPIDLDALSITNNKRVLAASIFADVSGFADFIDRTKTVEEKKKALRVFHAIRKELAAVIKTDYEALRIQYQGDRVQALVHSPQNDEARITERAVEITSGLQSSMDYVLHTALPESKPLGLAVGIDLDTTLVSKTGTRGERDRICIGLGVERAAHIQELSDGTESSLTAGCYELLNADLQKRFALDDVRKFYFAKNLYADTFVRLARAAAYSAGGTVAVRTSSKTVSVDHREGSSGTRVLPSRSWCP